MIFKIGDYIKSNRPGTIGYDTIRRVIGYKTVGKDSFYILERFGNESIILELSEKFTNKNYKVVDKNTKIK